MATTTNFGWETPDDTDLVKDGALAMRTLGNAIDASLVDLKGGTTGQVLSKNSNTDMDFTWVTSDDANAIQNAIVDAKGDLITATAADTPARLAVGSDTAPLVADSGQATGLRWDSGGWTTYTPVWTASGTAPSLGNGTITGNYQQRGKTINGRLQVTFGSTSTFGSGNYFFSLPVNAAAGGVGRIICTGYVIDSSAGQFYQVFGDTNDGVNKITLRCFKVDGTRAVLQSVNSNDPMTFANTDEIQIAFTYEAA